MTRILVISLIGLGESGLAAEAKWGRIRGVDDDLGFRYSWFKDENVQWLKKKRLHWSLEERIFISEDLLLISGVSKLNTASKGSTKIEKVRARNKICEIIHTS